MFRICRTSSLLRSNTVCLRHNRTTQFSSKSPNNSRNAWPEWLRPKKAAIGALKIANFVLAVHFFATYVARPSFMSGPSMLPTFSGDASELVVEEMITHTLFPNTFLARGDLITLESPLTRGRLVCKRLIGLPGDFICIDPTGQYADASEHLRIPKGHVWVSGDNLTASRDSRVYGPVPIGLVKGRIVARIWPPSKWTIFRSGMTYLN